MNLLRACEICEHFSDALLYVYSFFKYCVRCCHVPAGHVQARHVTVCYSRSVMPQGKPQLISKMVFSACSRAGGRIRKAKGENYPPEKSFFNG